MRRLEQVWAQLADERNTEARVCTHYVLSKMWDEAAESAKRYSALAARCDDMIIGRIFDLDAALASDQENPPPP